MGTLQGCAPSSEEERGPTIYDEFGGATLLFAAAENGRREVARLLLDQGAAVNQASNDGCTPLFVANDRIKAN